MTDKIRIEVLKEAKKRIECEGSKFICIAINNTLRFVAGLNALDSKSYHQRVSRIFPELRKHKPKGKVWGKIWWEDSTDLKDNNIRLKVLNSIIKEIKAKSND